VWSAHLRWVREASAAARGGLSLKVCVCECPVADRQRRGQVAVHAAHVIGTHRARARERRSAVSPGAGEGEGRERQGVYATGHCRNVTV
jgi:hypothetical protein